MFEPFLDFLELPVVLLSIRMGTDGFIGGKKSFKNLVKDVDEVTGQIIINL